MSETGKAVFLSYASQDAEAAKKICEALRQAGVEVWFDQSELVGGDAWDQKIRKQIRECALLIPVVSKATQGRREAYFRLEWKLADERTHLMAKGTPFLLPVTIDETSDRDALVPDSFLAVQWTKAPAGETPLAFAGRVKKLLDDGTASPVAGVADPGRTRRDESPGSTTPATARLPRWLRPVLASAVIVIAVLAVTLITRRDHETAAGTAPPVARAVPAQSPADELVAKAWALLDDDPLMTRANVELAEQLSLQAIAKDETNAEAYAAAAWANFRYIEANYEDTPKRRADLKTYAEKARLLAPASVNAELAMCGMLLTTDNRDEATKRLRALADRVPDNLTVLRAYAGAAPWANGVNWSDDEKADRDALARLRALSPVGAAYADTYQADQYWAKGDYNEVDRRLDAIFAAGHPVRLPYLLRLLVLVYGWGDLPAAQRFIATLPAKLQLEDVFITHITYAWLYSGDYDKALATLDRTQREMLQEAKIQFPTAMLRGEVLAAGGRPGAAAIQWRSALAFVEKQLAGSPGNPGFHLHKSQLLARLGDREGAMTELRLALEIVHPTEGTLEWGAWWWHYFAYAGDLESAISRLDRSIARDNGRWPNDYNDLRYDPAFAELRKDPRVQAIMARASGWLAELRRGAPVADASSSAKATEDWSGKALAPDQKSVAVLPFENRSAGSEDAAFFADGIQEDLINTLSRVPGLKVIARTAVLPYRGGTSAPSQIAQELGVTHLVEAGVQRAGDRVRLNVQLVRAGDGEAVWSERYDRTLSATNIFDLQEEITQAVARTLQLKLGAQAGAKLLTGTTGNLAAYEAFLKGRNEYSQNSIPEAVRLLQEAVRLDPDYALAHGALAEAYVAMGNGGYQPSAEAFPLAKASAGRALELDDHIVQAYTALAEYAFHYDWNWAAAEQSMLRALAIDPNYANAYARHAGHLAAWGRFAEARAAAQRAAELSPKRKNFTALAMISLSEKRYQEVLDQTADQAASDNPAILMMRGNALFQTGHPSEGLERLERLVKLHPDLTTFQASLGWAYAQSGQAAKAREIVQRLQTTAQGRYVSPLDVAQVAAGLNDRDLAFAQLQKAFTQRDPNLPFIGGDQAYDLIRDDPRFRELLKQLKLDVFFPETAKK